jgi:hypothetical protein
MKHISREYELILQNALPALNDCIQLMHDSLRFCGFSQPKTQNGHNKKMEAALKIAEQLKAASKQHLSECSNEECQKDCKRLYDSAHDFIKHVDEWYRAFSKETQECNDTITSCIQEADTMYESCQDVLKH